MTRNDPNRVAVVVTTINEPNSAMRSLAAGCAAAKYDFIVVGDQKSPPHYSLEGTKYLSLALQLQSGFRLARSSPVGHYSRKNLGYLEAIMNGAEIVIETDDDNVPIKEFWQVNLRKVVATELKSVGWVNVYQYFTDTFIWPRGFPLDRLKEKTPQRDAFQEIEMDCPIQQGLADGDPDVDAIFRMLYGEGTKFTQRVPIGLSVGSWCPFNSQNTRWWKDAFPLMYLPSFCSFRMTDIWRSFVAQRIAHLNGWSILFHSATVYQERNVHNLLRDFEQEVPGYLNNEKIVDRLLGTPLVKGVQNLSQNLLESYRSLVDLGLIGQDELQLVDCWLDDLNRIQ